MWSRGLKAGRYKAVEDILAQTLKLIPAELFFMWALIGSKRVHYEFLDNSVAEGCPPCASRVATSAEYAPNWVGLNVYAH